MYYAKIPHYAVGYKYVQIQLDKFVLGKWNTNQMNDLPVKTINAICQDLQFARDFEVVYRFPE